MVTFPDFAERLGTPLTPSLIKLISGFSYILPIARFKQTLIRI